MGYMISGFFYLTVVAPPSRFDSAVDGLDGTSRAETVDLKRYALASKCRVQVWKSHRLCYFRCVSGMKRSHQPSRRYVTTERNRYSEVCTAISNRNIDVWIEIEPSVPLDHGMEEDRHDDYHKSITGIEQAMVGSVDIEKLDV